MKVILSRKGFDSAIGGFPSPILPDGEMISLPIPSRDSLRYSDLKIRNGVTYCERMKQLRPTIKTSDGWHIINEETTCHLDPDIHENVIDRNPGWRPCFGQTDSAQGHLKNQDVCKNDLFLFFGWFRKTKICNGKLEYDPQKKEKHAIFGYFQIDEIVKVDRECKVPDWMSHHPHADECSRSNDSNTIYIARPELSWNRLLPGAGRFEFREDLVLTKQGLSRSKWCLPDCFRDAEISFHNRDSWKEGYFQSAPIGQEFVVKDNEKVEEWAKYLIEGARIDNR